MYGYTELVEMIRTGGLECLGRFYSIYPAVVVDIDGTGENQKQGRIKVRVPQLTDNQTIDEWAYPVLPLGSGGAFLSMPRKGDSVWVTFKFGDPRYPLWLGSMLRAKGGQTELPNSAADDYPLVHVWETQQGQAIIMNDKTGRIDITVRQGGGVITIDGGNVYLNGTDQFAVLGDTLKTEITKLDTKFDALISVLQAWIPIPNDGGAALKTALATVFGLPDADFSQILSNKVKLA